MPSRKLHALETVSRYLASLCAGLLLSLVAASRSDAQELRRQPNPFSVWLDFRALSQANTPRMALPIWLESIVSEHPRPRAGEGLTTIYRLRLRRFAALSKDLQVRVFFDDDPVAAPAVTGWTETGGLKFQSGPLGSGLGLPNSAEVIIPTEDLDYLDISVAGNGTAIHGAFLSSVSRVESKAAVDFPPELDFFDPFGKAGAMKSSVEDSYLFGRVRAALIADPVKLTPTVPAAIEFQLDRPPLLAVVSFEVLDADIAAPPGIVINGFAAGPATLQLPDLADPGYRGEVIPRQAEQLFRYRGWLRAQKIVPASALHSGLNQLALALSFNAQPVAIRAVEIELKYEWNGVEAAR